MAYIDNANGFRFAGTLSGSPAPTARVNKLDVNQTITKGDLLTVSSGYLQIAAASSVLIVGLALESKTASASVYQDLLYLPITPDCILAAQCSGTPTIASLFTTTTSALDIEGTTGIMEINEDASSYDVLMAIGLEDDDAGFGANARLLCVFIKSVWKL